jgi:hypothetical protein
VPLEEEEEEEEASNSDRSNTDRCIFPHKTRKRRSFKKKRSKDKAHENHQSQRHKRISTCLLDAMIDQSSDQSNNSGKVLEA